MEQCWPESVGGNGASLLQKFTSTAALASGLLTDGDAMPTLLAENASVVSSHASLLATGTEFRSVGSLVLHFASHLPNITSYEDNQQELSSALILNVSVFIFGLGVWGISVWWKRRSESNESDATYASSDTHTAGSDVSARDRCHLDVHGDVPKRNYLLYLLVCMYCCIALSFVNVCFLLPHGLVGTVFFGGWSILMVLNQVSFAEIYCITFLDGCIVLSFTKLFEHLIEIPEGDSSQDQLRRTVWMQGLPTHDSVRWWKPFRINSLEAGRVRHDLMEALTDYLHVQPQHEDPAVALSPLRSLSRSASERPSSGPIPAFGGGGGHMPVTPPPVDLQQTTWRCCLDKGNPYYRNVVTGAVQWDMPSELALKDHPVDGPVVEDIQIALVLDDWHHAHNELQQAREYLVAYEEKLDRAQHALIDEEQPAEAALFGGLLNYVWRLLSRPAVWWYERKITVLRPSIDFLSKDLERIHSAKKLMSGSAFVTFKHPRYRDQLLQEELEDDPVASWLPTARSYTYFSFGRPPFASVTLSCERTPHPSDLNWQNLHVAQWQREVVFWVLASLLLFVMVALVTVVRISEFVMPIVDLARLELKELENQPVWRDYVPIQIKQFLTGPQNDLIWRSFLDQVPTMLLLFINSTIVPYMITAIAACERTVKLSDAERTRMLVNFFFLFTNTVVVPFCGVASLNELLTLVLEALKDGPKSNAVPFQGLIFASPGVFALKYIMSATFISSANQLLQIPQYLSKWCELKFLAVTERHKKDLQQPWPFHWGYWYAWTLSIFALGINISVVCPSTLPIAGLFFLVKYHVDKYNLDNGTYACGTDVEGGLAVRVVCYLRVVVALWWLAMGALSYAIAVFDPQENLTVQETLWLRRGGITLMVLGTLTFLMAWWLRAQHLQRLQLHGPGSNRKLHDWGPAISFWEQLGEALYLKKGPSQVAGSRSESLPGLRSSSQDESAGAPVPTNSKTKKKEQPLSWDGAKLLGL